MNRSIVSFSKRQWVQLLILGTLGFGTELCEAHKEPIHQRIATNAVLSSEGLARFANETLGSSTNALQFQPWEFSLPKVQPPFFWVGRGAYNQDYWPRWGNHFYVVKPGRVAGQANGLSDSSERYLDVIPLPLPKPVTNSFVWATVPGTKTPKVVNKDNVIYPWHWAFPIAKPPPTNDNSWQIARECQLIGLTNSSRTTRDENLAHMFYSLGHIIHLNQDTSQPDHTRDDAHPNRVFIEDYGLGDYNARPDTFNPVPRGWAYWRDQAHFTRLLDFWDRGFYQGDAAALDADNSGNPAAKLGLAEFSNGNLLGENALYAEFFENKSNKTHYFPHPALKDTDQPQVRPFLDSITLVDGTIGNSPYLQKTRAGTNITHHSALRYFAVMNMARMSTLPARTAVTIKNDNVLSNYHDIMIPKAIEYSGGILDYFFRGSMAVSVVGYDTNTMTYTNQIMNTSGEAFGPGFYAIYQDDASGDRTQVASTNLSTALQGGDGFTMAFSSTNSLTNKTLVVYRGSIGLTNSNQALDPVDADIAIALASITSCQTPECWIAGLQINRATPEFSVTNQTVVDQQNALDFYAGACAFQGGWFISGGECCSCWYPFWVYNFWGVCGVTEDSVFCTYNADVAFGDVILHPSSAWLGTPFTLLITSDDPRIQISPSSMTISSGFSGDINLHVTQIDEISAVTFSDVSGTCIPPADTDYQINITPILGVGP